MTIHILITGVLHKTPATRTSKTGSQFVTANVRSISDGATTWCSVIAFDLGAQDELLRLEAGDSVSIQGKAKLSTYVNKDGETTATLDVEASKAIGMGASDAANKARKSPIPTRRHG